MSNYRPDRTFTNSKTHYIPPPHSSFRPTPRSEPLPLMPCKNTHGDRKLPVHQVSLKPPMPKLPSAEKCDVYTKIEPNASSESELDTCGEPERNVIRYNKKKMAESSADPSDSEAAGVSGGQLSSSQLLKQLPFSQCDLESVAVTPKIIPLVRELPFANCTSIPYSVSLPPVVDFTIDWISFRPVMLDSGAAVSLIPRHILTSFDPAITVPLINADNSCFESIGTVSVTIDLGLGIADPFVFTVHESANNFITIGIDYLRSYPYLVHAFDRNMLYRTDTGKGIHLIHFQPNQFSEELFWDKLLALPPCDINQPLPAKAVIMAPQPTGRERIDKRIRKILSQLPRLCSEPDFQDQHVGHHKLTLITKKEFTPKYQKPRPLSTAHRKFVHESFLDLEKRGVVKRGSSTMSSPLTLVTKKDGTPRICVDYTYLNKYTVSLNYPLPQIQSLPTILTSEHCWFSTLDLKSAYFVLPMDEKTASLASISTHCGNWIPLRTQFGLKNAPAKFCELVAEMLSGFHDFCFTYLDDFLVFSKSLEEHVVHLNMLLTRLDEWNMFLNLEKSLFAQQEVDFVGHHISSAGMRPITSKIEALKQLKPPTTVSQVRSFLGSINYYRQYLPNLAHSVSPINNLLKGSNLKKNAKVLWGEKEQKAFDCTISALSNACTLAFEDPTRPLVLTTDASGEHVGAVLEQFESGENQGPTRPLGFFSREIPTTSKPRSTFNRELNGIYMAVRFFKHRIYGRELIIRTDHKSLVSAIDKGIGEHSIEELRRIGYIKEFLPTMTFIAGEENCMADYLSRPCEDPLPENSATPLPCSTVLNKSRNYFLSIFPSIFFFFISFLMHTFFSKPSEHSPHDHKSTPLPCAAVLTRAQKKAKLAADVPAVNSTNPPAVASRKGDLARTPNVVTGETTATQMKPAVDAIEIDRENKNQLGVSGMITRSKTKAQTKLQPDAEKALLLENCGENADADLTPKPPDNNIEILISPELLAEAQQHEPWLIEQTRKLANENNSTIQISTRNVTSRPDLLLYGVTHTNSSVFRPVVPSVYQAHVFHLLHSTIHEGKAKSVELVAANYYWPNFKSTIEKWVSQCPECQKTKISRHNRAKLSNFPENFNRLHTIHCDLVGPLPRSHGHVYLLTMRDRVTGFTLAAPLRNKKPSSVLRAFRYHFIAVFGIPSCIVTDNGGEFVARTFADFCNKVGVVHRRTTAYHPQSNGCIERVHRILKVALRSLDDENSWFSHLPRIILALNNLPVDQNSFTPFQMLVGQAGQISGTCPLEQPDNFSTPDLPEVHAFFECMAQHRKKARKLPDNKHYIEDALWTCKAVWVLNNAPAGPLAPRYTGPYKVLSRNEKFFTILHDTQGVYNASIDRLKAANLSPTHSVLLSDESDVEIAHSPSDCFHLNIATSSSSELSSSDKG